ncbi:MAG: hypothetical protein ACKPEA_04920, partial [Planctomycetota bacterium]
MNKPSKNMPLPGGAALERQNLRDRVNACLASGQFADAVALLEAPLQRNPRDAEILRLCAMVQHRAGHGGAAAHFAERAEAIESHPNTIMIVDVGVRPRGAGEGRWACGASHGNVARR